MAFKSAIEISLWSFVIISLSLQTEAASKTGSVGCGVQAPDYAPRLPSKTRIINGQTAKPHSWPWAVALERNGYINCGGTLVRVRDDYEESDIVLTAAHCVGNTDDTADYDGWTVKAGAQWWGNYQEKGVEVRKVIKAVHHPNYVPVKNDIAILQLESTIKFSDTIRPPCLPQQGADPPIGKYCVVAGWGRNNSDDAYQPSDTLQQSVQPVHDGSVCKKPWGGTFQPDMMICVGVLDGTSGVCNGDSGGMLTCYIDGSWVQHGVLSYVGGKGRCVAPGWPSVFTRVSTYMDWIQQQIKAMSSLMQG